MRAQRMGRADYAIKCFTEALALQEDFETMGYLVQVYIQSNELDEARKLLVRMIRTEPEPYLYFTHPCQRLLHAGGLCRHGGSCQESCHRTK